MGANGLIGTTCTPLGDYFWGNVLKIFSKKNLLKAFKNSMYYFVNVCVKNLPKNVIFKVFQVHLKVLLLLKSSGYDSFYIIVEGPNVLK